MNSPERSKPEPDLVRPYTLTSGRTDTTVDLPVEAPIDLEVGSVQREHATIPLEL